MADDDLVTLVTQWPPRRYMDEPPPPKPLDEYLLEEWEQANRKRQELLAQAERIRVERKPGYTKAREEKLIKAAQAFGYRAAIANLREEIERGRVKP
jgi:hypothetical protein